MAQAPQMPPQAPPAMAAGGGLMGMMPHSDGVAALHSGLHDMAGGGIVAFADGGDVPSFAGDKGSFIDPEFRTRDPKKINEAKFNILAQELRDQQEVAQKSDGEDKQRALNNIQMIQREMRMIRPATDVNAGINALIPSAQAAEPQRSPSGPAMAKAEASKAAAPKTQEESDRESIAGGIQDFIGGTKKLGAAAKDVLTLPGRAVAGAAESVITRPLRAMGVDVPYLPDDFYGGDRSSMTPYMDAIRKKEQSTAALPPIAAPSAKPAAAKPESTTVNTLNPRGETSGETQAVEEKPAMGPERPSIMDRVMGNITPTELEKPTQKTIQSVAQEQKDADKLYGVDTAKMFDDLRQDFRKSSGNLKDRSEKAAGMAFMMFGAGLMGAKKGRVGEALSKSGQQALGTYMGAMDKINDNEDKLNQRMQDLTMAENQFNRSRSDKALAEVQANKRDIQAIEIENAKLKNHAMIEGAKMTVDYFKNANPPAYQYLQRVVEAKRAEGNPNYSITDALRDEKTGAAKGEVTDKELQDAYEARRKEIIGTEKLKEFDRQFPTWKHFADAQRRSGGASSSKGAVDKSNPLLAN